jgi:glutamyl-tRNA synthetase
MSKLSVRVRFAPSPTGPLHMGGVRTALYNFLFARKSGGKLLLRIEDTDQNRYVPGAEEYIIESLKWCGIRFDEGIEEGGSFGPYRQSDRMAIYREFAFRLVDKGHAYYAFDTPEELEEMRKAVSGDHQDQFKYNYRTRTKMKNSLMMPEEEVMHRISKGEPYVIRILIPENQEVVFHDLIRGEVRFQSENLDDKVLFKSDGLPTYHLANVVDDYLMKITHVIRGEEWLPSAPMHMLLYRYFGWEQVMPEFAHLPLLLKPDGNGKLSKRDGDRLGFPVFPLQWKDPQTGEVSHGYREDGYIPEAFMNMLAFLGWNPGTEKELYTMDELIHDFSLDRVGKHGSKFDPEKARWFNHQYLQNKSLTELAEIIKPLAAEYEPSVNQLKLEKVCAIARERSVLLTDLWKNSWYFFKPPDFFDEQVKEKVWMSDAGNRITRFIEEIKSLATFNLDTFHNLVQDYVKRNNIKMGQLMNPLRLLIVGSNEGAGMMEIADVLGKEGFISRVQTGLKMIKE